MTYKKVTGVVRICGNYCAFHEASIYCDWVFGNHPITNMDILDDNEEAYEILKQNKLLTEKGWFPNVLHATEAVKKQLDELVSLYIENFDGDGYSDMEEKEILAAFNKDGVIVDTYISV